MDESHADMDNPTVHPAPHSPSRILRALPEPPLPGKRDGFPGQRIVVLPRAVIREAQAHPLLEGVLPTDVGFFPQARDHRRERPQGSEQAIIILCTHGGGWAELAGRRHEVGPGDLLVLPPGIPHAYGARHDAPWTIPWIHVTGRLVPNHLAALGVGASRPLLRVGHDPRALALFEEVLDTLEHGYLPSQLAYAAQVTSHLLGRLARLGSSGAGERHDPAEAVRRAIEFMKLHLDRPLRVPGIAAVAGLSTSHFTSVFRAATGYPPLDYHIRLRMHRACQLLDTTDLPVKEIASRLGYEDALYFSRAFRAVVERAPSEYRQERKG